MKTRIQNNIPPGSRSGLTLLEILVSMSILIIIVFGLMATFNQTQKIFRSSLTNVDVLEGGRSAIDMISRDLEQMTAANNANLTNVYLKTNVFGSFNFPISGSLRSNSLQQIYFLSHPADWQGVGFRVLDTNSPTPDLASVGTLYRFAVSQSQDSLTNFFKVYNNVLPVTLITNRSMNRIIDGVIHFSMKFYDSSGVEIMSGTNLKPQIRFGLNQDVSFSGMETPAYIELELGIIEPPLLEQIKSMTAPGAANAYLARHTEKIHFFRSHIPIRTARK